MEKRQTKRPKTTVDSSALKQKVQDLPLLCVEAICKLAPTSQLMRLHSTAVPLPGAFWSCGLKEVLKKRLPLTLQNELPFDRSEYHAKALFDIAGAKVAVVKDPEAFRFCPLLEFIESATLTVRVLASRFAVGPLPLHVVHGDALLACIPNVKHLALSVHPSHVTFLSQGLHELSLEHLLPQLQSFEVNIPHRFRVSSDSHVVDEAFARLVDALRIDEMSCLRRLVLPEVAFDCLMQACTSQTPRMQTVLAGLSSLGIGQNVYSSNACTGEVALNFISVYCGQLSQLQIVVRDKFSAYLAAFRALPGLTSLGLCMLQTELTGLSFDGSEAIRSVSDLRIVYCFWIGFDDVDLRKVAVFFPNVNAVALHTGRLSPLVEAPSLFGERQLFPALAKLSCFTSCDIITARHFRRLTEFLANPRLPEVVDFSPIIFNCLARNDVFLTAIYLAMQRNSIKRLLLRGPLHGEALPHLQGHIDLNGENVKISARKDRDLGDQSGVLNIVDISEQTDFTIHGTKTGGCLKGEQFTIRVFHQLAKRVDIFD